MKICAGTKNIIGKNKTESTANFIAKQHSYSRNGCADNSRIKQHGNFTDIKNNFRKRSSSFGYTLVGLNNEVEPVFKDWLKRILPKEIPVTEILPI